METYDYLLLNTLLLY